MRALHALKGSCKFDAEKFFDIFSNTCVWSEFYFLKWEYIVCILHPVCEFFSEWLVRAKTRTPQVLTSPPNATTRAEMRPHSYGRPNAVLFVKFHLELEKLTRFLRVFDMGKRVRSGLKSILESTQKYLCIFILSAFWSCVVRTFS